MEADLQRNCATVVRDTDESEKINAARIHVTCPNWHALRKMADLTFPCKEYNGTETTVDFEFTDKIQLAEVNHAMLVFRKNLIADGEGLASHYVDAAPP